MKSEDGIMRKLVLALGGSVVFALVAWPIWRGATGAQAGAVAMDSTTAWVLAAGDTAGLPGPRQLELVGAQGVSTV